MFCVQRIDETWRLIKGNTSTDFEFYCSEIFSLIQIATSFGFRNHYMTHMLQGEAAYPPLIEYCIYSVHKEIRNQAFQTMVDNVVLLQDLTEAIQ